MRLVMAVIGVEIIAQFAETVLDMCECLSNAGVWLSSVWSLRCGVPISGPSSFSLIASIVNVLLNLYTIECGYNSSNRFFHTANGYVYVFKAGD